MTSGDAAVFLFAAACALGGLVAGLGSYLFVRFVARRFVGQRPAAVLGFVSTCVVAAASAGLLSAAVLAGLLILIRDLRLLRHTTTAAPAGQSAQSRPGGDLHLPERTTVPSAASTRQSSPSVNSRRPESG